MEEPGHYPGFSYACSDFAFDFNFNQDWVPTTGVPDPDTGYRLPATADWIPSSVHA